MSVTLSLSRWTAMSVMLNCDAKLCIVSLTADMGMGLRNVHADFS